MFQNLDPRLVLIRGLPGSGKSTLAQQYSKNGFVHLEADMFFVINGVYMYDPGRIREAHHWCKDQTRRTLRNGHKVVVANTFTTLAELRPYLRMSSSVQVLEATGTWPSIHNVPHERIKQMARRWEPLPESWARENYYDI